MSLNFFRFKILLCLKNFRFEFFQFRTFFRSEHFLSLNFLDLNLKFKYFSSLNIFLDLGIFWIWMFLYQNIFWVCTFLDLNFFKFKYVLLMRLHSLVLHTPSNYSVSWWLIGPSPGPTFVCREHSRSQRAITRSSPVLTEPHSWSSKT
jgi:hypothetical protein